MILAQFAQFGDGAVFVAFSNSAQFGDGAVFVAFSNSIDNTTKKLYNVDTTKKLYRFHVLEHNMKVHTYENSSGKDLIKKYIDKLSKEEQVDGYSVLQAFEEDRIDELNIKPWQGKVWEVYFYKHNRIFYVTIEKEDVYLLHACRKQKNKTETTDKNIVISRAKELGILLNKSLI